MNARDVQRYKRLLLAKLDELSTMHADAEAELHIRLHQTDARLLRSIEDALARISQDGFGVCEVCKQDISKARLEAVPWTRLCRDCKEHEQN